MHLPEHRAARLQFVGLHCLGQGLLKLELRPSGLGIESEDFHLRLWFACGTGLRAASLQTQTLRLVGMVGCLLGSCVPFS